MSNGLWVVVGAVIAAGAGISGDLLRERFRRQIREEERRDRHLEQDRERFEEVYRHAVTRLTVCHDALHRAVRMLYCRDHAQGYEPYSLDGSVDWAVAEADAMRGAQPLLDLFGSPIASARYGDALRSATSIREAMTGDDDWDHVWAKRQLAAFDEHHRAALEEMRANLQAVRRTSDVAPPEQLRT